MSQKLNEIGDLQLAFMLEELATAREEETKEPMNIEEMAQNLHKTLYAPTIVVNEEAIFHSVIDMFKHVKPDPTKNDGSLSHEFTFEGFKNGEYLGKMDEEEFNNASGSQNEGHDGMFLFIPRIYNILLLLQAVNRRIGFIEIQNTI